MVEARAQCGEGQAVSRDAILAEAFNSLWAKPDIWPLAPRKSLAQLLYKFPDFNDFTELFSLFLIRMNEC